MDFSSSVCTPMPHCSAKNLISLDIIWRGISRTICIRGKDDESLRIFQHLLWLKMRSSHQIFTISGVDNSLSKNLNYITMKCTLAQSMRIKSLRRVFVQMCVSIYSCASFSSPSPVVAKDLWRLWNSRPVACIHLANAVTPSGVPSMMSDRLVPPSVSTKRRWLGGIVHLLRQSWYTRGTCIMSYWDSDIWVMIENFEDRFLQLAQVEISLPMSCSGCLSLAWRVRSYR